MRMTRASRRVVTAAVGGVLALGLVACSSDDDESDDTTSEESVDDAESEGDEPDADDADDAEIEEVDDEDEPEDDGDDADDEGDEGDDADASAGDGDYVAAEWAEPVSVNGDQIATIEGDGFEVEVYQVGVTESPKDGMLADPDTNEPILAEGDEIVFVNFVVTNTSDEPVDLSSSLVNVDATYEDWEYLQGMDSITDNDLYAEMEVYSSGAGYLDPPIYTFGPGESFSYGTNFMYKTDSPVIFDATLTPVDEEGELISDERREASAEATLS
ncbi:hypothetical protein [Phytoactinopolyspora endophytica]|uniref:hypothetical protein n=1 Tax=Phytoactinopolyspora endophytica TaxID=1642495 RepID=UPI00101CE6F8|nr:hypothetical protein [Phytoactinopolyspora endophytica]